MAISKQVCVAIRKNTIIVSISYLLSIYITFNQFKSYIDSVSKLIHNSNELHNYYNKYGNIIN